MMTVVTLVQVLSGEEPFAVRVLEYSPAPGQFVNSVTDDGYAINDPIAAVGAPDGGGTADGALDVVTLGGFGGSIALAFDHMVEDHPLNPYGMDAIVFGNAWWVVGDVNRHWAECGTIEISLDANENDVADDPWYLIPGSHISQPVAQFVSQTWDNNTNDATYPPADALWIPPGFFAVGETMVSTVAYALPLDVFGNTSVVNPLSGTGQEGVFGYTDYTPTLFLGDLDGDDFVDDFSLTPEEFYTVADNPYFTGISAGSGGGDAFDIAWAIDPSSGAFALLPGFHFLRITTSVNAVLGPFGEKSVEVDAVSDVRPDLTGDADGDVDIDLRDISFALTCLSHDGNSRAACAPAEINLVRIVEPSDLIQVMVRMTGP